MISSVFNNVSYPVLSSIQDNNEKLGRIYLQFLRTISFITTTNISRNIPSP
ncbi:MAG: oligosaccharide flippase family protein [Nostocales cyanobacterium W4_Combined_metabat2_030]|nr:oligosaccharide flippase family protein [Nostocales cyanobacterium W4_Combined_metabat2_030]